MVTATQEERMVRAWRDQVQTRVKIAGSGPPVVYLHGAYGLQWDPFIDSLTKSHTVYAPEHPGTTPGLPDEIKPIDNLWDLVLYYYELFDALGLDRPAIVAHSFGGMVAAEIAATCPERVGKLVLIDPIGLWRDEAPVRNWMAITLPDLPKYIFADPEGPLGKMMSAAIAQGAAGEGAIDAQIQMMWSLACTAKFVWPIPDKGLKKRIHRITAPTLVVWGKQDGINPVIYANDFGEKIKGARVEIIDKAGHLPQLEQLTTVSQLVSDFLA